MNGTFHKKFFDLSIPSFKTAVLRDTINVQLIAHYELTMISNFEIRGAYKTLSTGII